MTRVVFDTNVLYSAILKPGSVPAKALDVIAAGLVVPCVSDEVFAEYRRVLFRRELDLHADRRHKLLEIISSVSLHVSAIDRLTVSDDEPDNRFLECAEAAEAHYLITGNIRHFPQMHRTTEIVTANQFLAIIIR